MIGIDVDLADPALYSDGDPVAAWAELRRTSPVYRNPASSVGPFWALTGYAETSVVLRDSATFSSERGMVLGIDPRTGDPAAGRMLVVTDRPRHPKLRKVVAGVFTARTLQRLERDLRSTVHELVGRATSAPACEFVDAVAARLPVAVVCDLLGLPSADRDWMYHLTSVAFGGGDPRLSGEVTSDDRAEAYAEIFDYYREVAESRRRNPADDLVSILVHGEIDGSPLDVEDVLLNCTNLIVGGNETTRHAASGGVLAFAERPELWQALRAGPATTGDTIEEILRWTTPGMHVLRTATRDVELGGTAVRAGEAVVAWLAAANRDPAVFEEPETFQPTRRPNKHLAFGHGSHFCLGAALARIELRALFEELAEQVERIELLEPARRVRSCVLRGIRTLPVRLVTSPDRGAPQ